MLKKILVCLLLPCTLQAQNVKKLHTRAIIVDSHNDILTASLEKKVSMDNDLKGLTHSDLERFKEG
ncbi:MAG: rane dipeptidase, partial [Sediminibacterium sp.]|nr:rane dipeptidase [Sediminibacterium sp.]